MEQPISYTISYPSLRSGIKLWLLSLPVSYIPLLLNQILICENSNSYSLQSICYGMVCDLDFFFSYLCILYALYIQGEYTKSAHSLVHTCKRLCVLLSIPLLIIWELLKVLPNLYTIYSKYSFWLNLIMFFVTLVLGFLMQFAFAIMPKEMPENGGIS